MDLFDILYGPMMILPGILDWDICYINNKSTEMVNCFMEELRTKQK